MSSTMFTMNTMTTTTGSPNTVREIEIPRMVWAKGYTGTMLLDYEITRLENYMIPESNCIISSFRTVAERMEKKLRDTPEEVTDKDTQELVKTRNLLEYHREELRKEKEALRVRKEKMAEERRKSEEATRSILETAEPAVTTLMEDGSWRIESCRMYTGMIPVVVAPGLVIYKAARKDAEKVSHKLVGTR